MVIVKIVRSSPGGYNNHGDPVQSTVVETEVPHMGVAPRTSNENNDRGRNGVVVGKSVYLYPNADVRHTDQIRVDDDLYDIEGEPGAWENPLTGFQPGIEVAIRRATG